MVRRGSFRFRGPLDHRNDYTSLDAFDVAAAGGAFGVDAHRQVQDLEKGFVCLLSRQLIDQSVVSGRRKKNPGRDDILVSHFDCGAPKDLDANHASLTLR